MAPSNRSDRVNYGANQTPIRNKVAPKRSIAGLKKDGEVSTAKLKAKHLRRVCTRCDVLVLLQSSIIDKASEGAFSLHPLRSNLQHSPSANKEIRANTSTGTLCLNNARVCLKDTRMQQSLCRGRKSLRLIHMDSGDAVEIRKGGLET
eukprot:1158021-Pelagomonas_calceolata.AAC.2